MQTTCNIKASMSFYKLPFYYAPGLHIFLSMHLLLWMNVMLDFICMTFPGLSRTGRERQLQNENPSSGGFEPTPDPFESIFILLDRLAIGLWCLNVLQTFTVSSHMICMNTRVTKMYQIDYGLMFSYTVLNAMIDNMYIGIRKADLSDSHSQSCVNLACYVCHRNSLTCIGFITFSFKKCEDYRAISISIIMVTKIYLTVFDLGTFILLIAG